MCQAIIALKIANNCDRIGIVNKKWKQFACFLVLMYNMHKLV